MVPQMVNEKVSFCLKQSFMQARLFLKTHCIAEASLELLILLLLSPKSWSCRLAWTSNFNEQWEGAFLQILPSPLSAHTGTPWVNPPFHSPLQAVYHLRCYSLEANALKAFCGRKAFSGPEQGTFP